MNPWITGDTSVAPQAEMTRRRRERLFYTGMSVAIFVTVFAGFGRTYYLGPYFGAHPLTPHGHARLRRHPQHSECNGRLPRGMPPVREPAEAAATASVALRILVAEDNEFNTRHLERLLVKRGHRVQLAANGRVALDLLGIGDSKSAVRTQQAEVEGERVSFSRTPEFDLLLLDLHMPDRDGFQVVQALREQEQTTGRHLPVIALTARSGKEDRVCPSCGPPLKTIFMAGLRGD